MAEKAKKIEEQLAEIKPVSYIWRRLLEENPIPPKGVVVEVAPGYEKKIGDALAMTGFKGTIILVEPDDAAAAHVQKLYQQIMPAATVKVVTKLLQAIEIGQDIPARVDALLANHAFDDMAIALAMHGKQETFFSREREDDTNLTSSIKELYDAITDKDYIHGILATIVIWKDFIQRLKPPLLIASQYPGRKLTMKKLTKRQNSGFIIIELLRDYYESYLKEQYRDKSFGQQGDPAWWIIARKPYIDLVSDLEEKPKAFKRLGESVFVAQQARRLNSSEYDVVYADVTYFKDMGYRGDIEQQARNFAVVLDDDPALTEPITVYVDRQKDATDIGLSGNLGSGRAAYLGKRHNIMGVGKTVLCVSTNPSHSTGKMELIGSLRRVVLSRWINYFTKSATRHPVVLALKESGQFKWSTNPVPLALLVRIDDGALDRPSHVEYNPAITIDFAKVLTSYARLDAQYFAYRFMLGAWSTGNYSLDGRMIDLETATFVKYRGPYNTTSTKYYHNFFGYEGAGFVEILQQLAGAKGLAKKDIKERFDQERRQYLARYFLALLGIDEAHGDKFFAKHPDQVLALSDQFEKLAKKISPKRTALNLFDPVPDEQDPSLLDMSNLFRHLGELYRSSKREEAAWDYLIRKNALAEVKPGIVYQEQLTEKGEVNRGEIFVRENAVLTHDGLASFLAATKDFVRELFNILDALDAEKCLPEDSYWHDQLKIINQNFPTLDELISKLKYWTEEYRTGRINPETLNIEIEKLCQLPYYPTGKNFDLRDIPLIDYLRPTGDELEILSRYLTAITYKPGVMIIHEGEEADSLFILVQGTCKIIVGDLVISKISDRGALIGEAVIFRNERKRTASVVAETAARLLQIRRVDLEEMATTYPKLRRLLANVLIQRKEGAADKVRDLEIFTGINPEDIKLFLADKASEKRFSKGDKIITQGEKVPGVHLLIHGSVSLSQSGKIPGMDDIELQDKPLTQGLFGERSVILDQGAVCTVTANEDAMTLFISEDDFRELLDQHPQLLRNCLDHISDYLRANRDRGSLISKLEKKLQREIS